MEKNLVKYANNIITLVKDFKTSLEYKGKQNRQKKRRAQKAMNAYLKNGNTHKILKPIKGK